MMMLVLIVLLVALLIPLTAVILDSQVGRALAARLEREREIGGTDATGRRLGVLEAEVERLNTELQRLDDESAFLHRLLEDKSASEGSLPPGDRTD
jgi:cell division protein FtsB